jgi:uncharacterized protein YjbI with pentapeptide repeats
MADEHQLQIILKGVEFWNVWRTGNEEVKVDLSEADLRDVNLVKINLREANLSQANLKGATLSGANLSGTNLHKANLSGSYIWEADLTVANLSEADISHSKLWRANFRGAKLMDADLSEANFWRADLSHADLTHANLSNASLVQTKIENAVLKSCKIYGLSAWDLEGNPGEQSSLIITRDGETEITVDDLQVAQFIYLLLKRDNLRKVIDTITTKAVLILGRFTAERKELLEAIADELRMNNLLPIIFDFERSPSRDFTETIRIIAGMSLFIVADITNPKSAPLELQATIPDYQIPFVPIIQYGEAPFTMFQDLIGKYNWVLKPILTYKSKEHLINGFKSAVIDRAWEKHKELQVIKAAITQTQSIDDFINNPY